MTNEKFKEMIEFAIQQEQEAVDFYTELAGKVGEPHVKETLLDFANQERGHKAKAGKAPRRVSAPSVPGR